MKKIAFTVTTALLILLIASTPIAIMARNPKDYGRNANSQFSFALIGDLPYGDAEVKKFDNLIQDINDADDIRFIMHTGDVKGGGERCDDELLKSRLKQFQKFQQAFILTPGDNDWTDCHRENNSSYDPLERLNFSVKLSIQIPKNL